MGFLQTIIGGAIPGISGIVGMLASDAAAKRQQRLMEEAINQLERDSNSDLYAMQGQGARELYSTSGRLSDALQSTGRGLNAALGEAGVYNSTATAGALTNQANQNASTLAGVEQRSLDRQQQHRSDTRRQVAGMRYNQAAQGQQQALYERGNFQQGLINLTGELVSAFAQDELRRAEQERERRSLLDAAEGLSYENPLYSAAASAANPAYAGDFPARPAVSFPPAMPLPDEPLPVADSAAFASPQSDYRVRMGGRPLALSVPGGSAKALTRSSGLQSSLQKRTQSNLARTGANRMRVNQAPMNGTRNQGKALPGNRPRRKLY